MTYDPKRHEPEAERIARQFHEHYEVLAVENGWTTQERSRVPWEDVPVANKLTMIATVRRLLDKRIIGSGL